MSERLQLALALQANPALTRNVCICAHIDHGKTTLTDTLLATNSLISRDSAGKLRFLDFLTSEQERCITMKSSSVSLLYNCTTGHVIERVQERMGRGRAEAPGASRGGEETAPPVSSMPFLINVIDTPGHLDFANEVLSALSLSDAAFLVVDALEGVCAQTRTVMRYLVTLGLDIVLVVNKVDRLYSEWMMTPYDAFTQLLQVVASVNELYASTKESLAALSLQGEANAANSLDPPGSSGSVAASGKGDAASANKRRQKKRAQGEHFSAKARNIVFASALHGWGFSLQFFAAKLRSMFPWMAEKYSVDELSGLLWNPSALLDAPGQEIRLAGKGQACRAPIFASLVLESLFHVYAVTAGEADLQAARKVYKKLFGKKAPATLNLRNAREMILKSWLPLGEVLFDAVILAGSPPTTTRNRITKGVMSTLAQSPTPHGPPSPHLPPDSFVAVCGKLLDGDALDIQDELPGAAPGLRVGTDLISDRARTREGQRYYALCRVIAGHATVGAELLVAGRPEGQQTPARVLGLLLPMGRSLLRYPVGSGDKAGSGAVCVLELSYHVPHYSVLYSSGLADVSQSPGVAESRDPPESRQGLSDLISLRSFDIGQYVSLPRPLVAVAIWPASITRYAGLLRALDMLMEVDTSARYEIDQRVGEIVLYTSGDVHLDRCCEELDRFLERDAARAEEAARAPELTRETLRALTGGLGAGEEAENPEKAEKAANARSTKEVSPGAAGGAGDTTKDTSKEQAGRLPPPPAQGEVDDNGYKITDVVLQLMEVCSGGPNITVNAKTACEVPEAYAEAIDAFQDQVSEWYTNRKLVGSGAPSLDPSALSQVTSTDGVGGIRARRRVRKAAGLMDESARDGVKTEGFSSGPALGAAGQGSLDDQGDQGGPGGPGGQAGRFEGTSELAAEDSSHSAFSDLSSDSGQDADLDLFNLEFQAGGAAGPGGLAGDYTRGPARDSEHAARSLGGLDRDALGGQGTPGGQPPASQSLYGDPLFAAALHAIDAACEARPEATDVSLDSLAERTARIFPLPAMQDVECARYAEMAMGRRLYSQFSEEISEKLEQCISRHAGLPTGLEFLLPCAEQAGAGPEPAGAPGAGDAAGARDASPPLPQALPQPSALVSRYSLLCICLPTKACEDPAFESLLDAELGVASVTEREPGLGKNVLRLKFTDVPEASRVEIFRALSKYCFGNNLRAGFVAEEPVANVTMICQIRGLGASPLDLDLGPPDAAEANAADPVAETHLADLNDDLLVDLRKKREHSPAVRALLATLTSIVLPGETRAGGRALPAYVGVPSFPTFSSAILDFTQTMRRAMECTNFRVAEPHLTARVTAGSGVSEADLQRCLARLRCQKVAVEYDSQHAVTMEVSAPRINCLILPSELRSECSGNVGIELRPGGFCVLPDNPQHLDVAATVDEEVEWGASGEHRLTDSSSNSRNAKLSAGASLSRETRFLAGRLSLTGGNCHYAGSNVAHRLVSLVRARKGLVLLGGQIVEAEKQRTLKKNR